MFRIILDMINNTKCTVTVSASPTGHLAFLSTVKTCLCEVRLD